MNRSRFVSQKFMRCGYTTGSCAAAAAKAAASMLFSQTAVSEVNIGLPGGDQLTLGVSDVSFGPGGASCAVKKDGGDDPDTTSGAMIRATVALIPEGIDIDGGEGVGRVTKPGLDQPVGSAAINSAPRRMIRGEVAGVMKQYGYAGGISVVISVPDGEKLAARTFNGRLGVIGGISILGTTGIVEPMSNSALVSSVRAELRVMAAAGEKKLLLVIGNYAERFLREVLALPTENCVKCGNFIGDALTAAVETGFDSILIAGHIGKLVKLGIGLTNTHSAYGDGRRETLIACALRAGAPIDVLKGIDECVTADAAAAYLAASGFLRRTMDVLRPLVEDTLSRQVSSGTRVGFICFSGDETLVESENAQVLIDMWRGVK